MDSFVLISGRSIMMRALMAVVLLFCLTSTTVYAKGGGSRGSTLTPEQIEVQRIEREKEQKDFATSQRIAQQQMRAEEKKEERDRTAAAKAAVEQVKMFRVYLGGGYGAPYFTSEKGVNSWLRDNPAVSITRVVSAESAVLIFYREVPIFPKDAK